MSPKKYSLIFFCVTQATCFGSWVVYETVKWSGKAWPKDLWFLKFFSILMIATGLMIIFKRLKQLKAANGNFDTVSEKIHEDTITEFKKMTLKQRKLNLAFGYGVLVLVVFILFYENDEYTPKVAFMGFFGFFVIIYQTYKFVVLKKIVSDSKETDLN